MKLKKISAILAISLLTTGVLGACSSNGNTDTGNAANSMTTRVIYMTDEDTADSASTESTGAKEVPEGMYLSETTGEPIDEAIKDQRPIAVMIDNDSRALDHYGTAEADVVYEMLNSTANNYITRLMLIVKDWGAIEQMGSIRSTRPTNLILFPEWNAVLCHDGGPFYNDPYFANDYTPHFSGTFARVDNGKPTEFTEYIVKGDLERNFNNSGVSPEYDEHRLSDESHFEFVEYGLTVDLETDYKGAFDASEVDLSAMFRNTGSRLIYNDKTETYDFFEHGRLHTDAEDDEVMTFKNVFLQCVSFNQLDTNGYLMYHAQSTDYNKAYYFTNGKGIEVFWQKNETLDHTRYFIYNDKGLLEEITINTGKTYIGLIPEDQWDEVVITD